MKSGIILVLLGIAVALFPAVPAAGFVHLPLFGSDNVVHAPSFGLVIIGLVLFCFGLVKCFKEGAK